MVLKVCEKLASTGLKGVEEPANITFAPPLHFQTIHTQSETVPTGQIFPTVCNNGAEVAITTELCVNTAFFQHQIHCWCSYAFPQLCSFEIVPSNTLVSASWIVVCEMSLRPLHVLATKRLRQ